MKYNLERDLAEIDKKGFVIKKNILKESHCNKLKKYLIKITNLRLIKGEKIYEEDGSVRICNFFLEDYKLTKLLTNNYLDNILNKLLGKDYVLRLANGMNVQKNDYEKKRLGTGWHTDWLYNYNNEKFGYGASYHVIFALDDFKKENGATHLIPCSHKKKNKPIRNKNYKSKLLIMKKGSMAIFDSSIWHKSGHPSNLSRWGLWCVYTHWWVKPYFRFNEIFSKSIRNKLSKKIKRLLHLNSIPPLNSKKRVLTVTKLSVQK